MSRNHLLALKGRIDVCVRVPAKNEQDLVWARDVLYVRIGVDQLCNVSQVYGYKTRKTYWIVTVDLLRRHKWPRLCVGHGYVGLKLN